MSHVPFKTMEKKLAKKGAANPAGLAAYIARKKYGGKALAEHAKSGTSMRDVAMKKYVESRRG